MAVDMFLKFDGIPGESRDAEHKGSIDITSFSWGESNTVSHLGSAGGGAGAGKVSMQDFHFTAKVSIATPKLMLSCANGAHIPTGVFSVRRAAVEQKESPSDFLVYKFQNVIITSVSEAGDTSDIPLDSVSFAFQKIDVMYKEQTAAGGIGATSDFSWDLAANKKI
jgi:type VI secretion system secreted protein Hcp